MASMTSEQLRSLIASYDALIRRLTARRERLRQELFRSNYESEAS